jgi:hypothetical protein
MIRAVCKDLQIGILSLSSSCNVGQFCTSWLLNFLCTSIHRWPGVIFVSRELSSQSEVELVLGCPFVLWVSFVGRLRQNLFASFFFRVKHHLQHSTQQRGVGVKTDLCLKRCNHDMTSASVLFVFAKEGSIRNSNPPAIKTKLS